MDINVEPYGAATEAEPSETKQTFSSSAIAQREVGLRACVLLAGGISRLDIVRGAHPVRSIERQRRVTNKKGEKQ
jgi:hypothetical protein